MNYLYEIVQKVGKFADEHRTAFDLTAGGAIGFIPTVIKYWHHFTQEENLFHVIDGVINTGFNTFTGAAILWILHKFIFKKKKDETHRDSNNPA